MANTEHIEILRLGAEAIAAYRGTNNRHMDLFGADLSGFDLRNAQLQYCDFRDANLIYADLSNAVLTHAEMANATLVGANLSSATMICTKLQKAWLCGANLANTNLSSANLTGAKLNVENFDIDPSVPASLVSANLERAILDEANLMAVDLTDANLSYARLNKANLAGANLSKAQLLESIVCQANLKNANLTGTQMQGANLRYSCLRNAKLKDANLDGCDLSGVIIDSTTHISDIKCYKLTIDRYALEYMRNVINHGEEMDLVIHDDFATLRSQFSGVWGTIHLIGIFFFLLPYALFVAQQVVASSKLARAESTVSTAEAWAKRQASHITFVSAEALQEATNSKIERTAKEWRQRIEIFPSFESSLPFPELTVSTAEAWVKKQASHITFVSAEALQEATNSKIERTAKEWRQRLGIKEPEKVTVLTALLRYIVNGGENWRLGYDFNASVCIPILLVAMYNILRLTLWIKTKKLETLESVRKLPVMFSMGSGWKCWRTVYRLNQIGYWVALALILKNTVYFLSSPIEI